MVSGRRTLTRRPGDTVTRRRIAFSVRYFRDLVLSRFRDSIGSEVIGHESSMSG